MPRSADEYALPAGTAAVANGLANSSHVNERFADLADEQNLVRPISKGGTGASSASAALTALGAQPLDSDLTAIAALGYTSGAYLIKKTAAGTYSLIALTAAGEALLDDADAAAQRATMGLGTVATESIVPISKGGTGAALVDPNADRLLFWDDSAGAFAFASVSGMAFSGTVLAANTRVLLATKTASASATLDFTEFNNAVYKWYEFELENVKPATDDVYLRTRFSTDAGATYDAGASNYQYMGYACGSGGLQNHASTGAVAIDLTYVGAVNIGNAAAELGVSGIVKVYNASLSAGYTRLFASLEYDDTTTTVVNMGLSGSRRAAQDTDAMRFLMSTGNITSGTIRMYGIVA